MAPIVTSVLVFSFVFLGFVNSGFVITTPRRWTVQSDSQVCFALTAGAVSSSDSLKLTLQETKHGEVLLNDVDLGPAEGTSQGCINVTVPYSEDRLINLNLTGSLSGEPVSESFNLTFVKETGRTFIQTDKYLYKPGQEVQFRILSVKGPNLTIVTENYEEVYITDPSRTRIAQWLNVENGAGLVHLSFNLYDEIPEGIYTIGTRLANQSPEEKVFRVEDYVLPRYEVTIEAPSDILGNDTSVTVKLCAKYTFGEPVNGNATLYLAAGSWKTYANLTQSKMLSGCENFTFPTKDLLFDQNNCHIRISTLKAYAEVVEDGTGVELQGSNDNIKVHRRGIQFRDQSTSWIKKPYLPSAVKIAAVRPDNTPAGNEPIQVCVFYEEEKVCKNFSTTNSGHITFVMPSQTDSRVEVRAVNHPQIERNWNNVMEESKYFKYNYNNEQYIDSANNSLTIFQEDTLECLPGEGVTLEVPVIYVVKDQPSADVYVQVTSRGQVIALKKMTFDLVQTDLPFKDNEQLLPLEDLPPGVTRGVFKVPMTLSEQSSPKIKVLVWYSTAEGNIVADSKEIEITNCLSYNVNFTWSTATAAPGESATFVLSGASDALCSIGMVDKSVDLLSLESNKLDVQSILQIAYNSEVAQWDSDQLNLEYCLRKYGSQTDGGTPDEALQAREKASSTNRGIIYQRFSMLEALHMFKNAGYFVGSNLGLEKLFCDDLIIQDLKRQVNLNQRPLVPFGDSQNRISSSPVNIQNYGGASAAQAGFSSEMDFDDSTKRTTPSQKEGDVETTQERTYLPETWLWDLKPLSSTGEFSEERVIPDTITEWIGRAVCVHPTKGVGISSQTSITTFTPFFVDLTLPSSAKRGEILPIIVSVFNYLQDNIPVKLSVEPSEHFQFLSEENGVREICISSNKKSVETIKVNLTQIGEVNLTVVASVEPISSGSCGSRTPPSKRDILVRNLPVEPEGYVREKTWTKYVCSQDVEAPGGSFESWTIEAPQNIVQDSSRSWITAIGDLLGPTIENVGHLIRFPSGCGEQNMVNFAPNVYILKYLQATNQSTEQIRAKVEKFLNQGYQVQQMFRHRNSSFSAFGERDKQGSTWLTAFVVKSFAQARPFIFIDNAALNNSANWLKSLQNEKGCFKPMGRVINKMLQGGIKGSAGSEGLLTAYVLIALLEEGETTENMINSAVNCIQTDTSDHPYSLALKSYSLALAQNPGVKILVDKLLANAVTNSSMIWWSLPDRKGENTALHVETAAYTLLGLVTLDPKSYAEESRKIVRWLSSQRNGQGGFISTQDTIVALQALAAFEESQPKGEMNLSISISSSDLNNTLSITEESKFFEQRMEVQTIPSTMELSLTGQGCALIQGVLRYNVLAESVSEAFVLRSETMQTEKDCRTQRISACTTYTLPDGASNMALLEIKLVSGYIPLKNDLKELIGDGKGTFKRYEVDGPKVVFYMEEVNSTEICLSFRVYQEVPIENAKPGSVTVYDYYQPEYTVTQQYHFTATCNPSSTP